MSQTLEEKRAYNNAWYTQNKERLHKKRAEWRKATPEKLREQRAKSHAKNREKRLAGMPAYYRKNRDVFLPKMWQYQEEHTEEKRQYLSTYYRVNREKASAKAKQYLKEHPEGFSERNKARRARKKHAPINDLTHAQWLEIQEAQNHCCAHCGKRCKGRLTQEHMTALTNGGSHTLHNVVAVCSSCNSKKGTKESPVLVQPLLLTIAPNKKPR